MLRLRKTKCFRAMMDLNNSFWFLRVTEDASIVVTGIGLARIIFVLMVIQFSRCRL